MKPWYQSKTMWFNLITIAVTVAGSPELAAFIPASWLPAIASGIALVNLILRTVTNTAVTR